MPIALKRATTPTPANRLPINAIIGSLTVKPLRGSLELVNNLFDKTHVVKEKASKNAKLKATPAMTGSTSTGIKGRRTSAE